MERTLRGASDIFADPREKSSDDFRSVRIHIGHDRPKGRKLPPVNASTVPTPPPLEAPRWASYIAIGDSITEGLSDPYPGQEGDEHNPGFSDLRFRGWADRLAETLSQRRLAAGQPALEYANLAIRGKKLAEILEDQVPAALAQKPDLISLVGGGNDVLRPGSDIDGLCQQLSDAVGQIRAGGIDVLLATGFRAGDPLAWTRGRTGQLNAWIWSIARKHGAYVLDSWGIESLYDFRLFAPDKIHPISAGHERMLNAALVGLGLAPEREGWDELLPPEEAFEIDPESRLPARAQPVVAHIKDIKEDAQWAREFAMPWVERRVRGTSSGDGRTAKYPTLTPWLPEEE